ncbi:MAG: M15 family metallopeptidase [Alphaproteobacteria bacterium]|nr:M15 family metallopeptidase [Alphaproteobacteria bacterium]
MAEFDTWDRHTNKRLATLHPKIRREACDLINAVARETGVRLRVTQAYRSFAEQDALFAQGRTAPGRIVTKAKGGQSYHNYGLAIDVCEIRDGAAIFDCPWDRIAPIAEAAGWEWGGRWTSFPDKPHFQKSFGRTTVELAQLHETARDDDGYTLIG